MFYSNKTVDEESKAVSAEKKSKKKTGIWAGLKNGTSTCMKKLIQLGGIGLYGYRIFTDGMSAYGKMKEDDEFKLDEVGKLAGDAYGLGHFVFGFVTPSDKEKKPRGVIGTAFNVVTTEIVRTGFSYAGSIAEGIKDGAKNGGEEHTGPVVMTRETLEGLVSDGQEMSVDSPWL